MRTRQMIIVASACVLAIVIAVLHTPIRFSPGTLLTIPDGASFSETAAILREKHVITSTALLRIFAGVLGGTRSVKAGDYLFTHPEGTAKIAWRLTRGEHGLESARVVLPEGLTIAEMGERIAVALPHFDAEKFEWLAYGKEGYLFPDTYFVMVNATPETLVAMLGEHSDAVLADLADDIATSGRAAADIVTMASILEEEAQTFEDKKIVAGILWKRLDIGMALQVDATFKYTLGKASHELTQEDLATDSPYNTYTRTGLPPTPISNPGRESLEAAIYPQESSYLFYLTGADGKMYYAEDFEGHKQNRFNHL